MPLLWHPAVLAASARDATRLDGAEEASTLLGDPRPTKMGRKTMHRTLKEIAFFERIRIAAIIEQAATRWLAGPREG